MGSAARPGCLHLAQSALIPLEPHNLKAPDPCPTPTLHHDARARGQVVTKRTKNLKKQEIPSLDDPISKLNHIGKETVKKLNELKAAADEANVDLLIPQALWRCAAAPRCSCAAPAPRRCARKHSQGGVRQRGWGVGSHGGSAGVVPLSLGINR
jgi:hypothetical protein